METPSFIRREKFSVLKVVEERNVSTTELGGKKRKQAC